MLELDVNS